jgi:hypothetical protein
MGKLNLIQNSCIKAPTMTTRLDALLPPRLALHRRLRPELPANIEMLESVVQLGVLSHLLMIHVL